MVAARLGMRLTEVYCMNLEELSLWAAFLWSEHDVENRKGDERAALLAAVTANCHSSRTFGIEDFMPRRRQVEDVKTMQAKLLAWASGFKGR